MDWNITCDDLSAPFEPTDADWVENDEVEPLFEDEGEVDFDEALDSFQTDFFGLVDTMNGYRV